MFLFLASYIFVADPSREGRSRDNSWLQFNWFIQTNRGTASPTRPQSVGGNNSPANALKPRILTYINHSSTVSHNIFTSPCFYHSSENITYNISHNPHFVPMIKIRPLSSRAQAQLTLRQLCFPSPGRIVRTGEPISGPDSGANVKCLTSSISTVPDTT